MRTITIPVIIGLGLTALAVKPIYNFGKEYFENRAADQMRAARAETAARNRAADKDAVYVGPDTRVGTSSTMVVNGVLMKTTQEHGGAIKVERIELPLEPTQPSNEEIAARDEEITARASSNRFNRSELK